MTEAKHTPGPWSIEVGNDPSDWANYFPKVLAENYTVVGTEGMYGDRETDLANARLIAAAPELLEALQESVQLFEVQSQMHRLISRRAKGMHGIAVDDDVLAIEWQSLRAIADCMIVRRDKAIAKATGN